MKYISSLQYITQKRDLKDIRAEVEAFLMGGGDWVQLRMKGASEREFTTAARAVKELCYSYNATFIVNDNLNVALNVNADGIHLGKGDMPTSAVRPLVGKKFIIGRTANSARDIEILSNQKIDYIGLGPYKHTLTKENLSTILGVEGYVNVFSHLREVGVAPPPIVAIGGIEIEDIPIIATIEGLSGIAVSGAIAKSTSPLHRTMEIKESVERHFNIKNYNLK